MSVSRETTAWRSRVSRETLDRLTVFEALLRRWTERINLVSRHDWPHLWTRHIADSLQLLPLLPNVPSGTDVGSGAGFPGLILCIATDLPFTLVEADQRKAAFLREAARQTSAPATIHARRIETLTSTSKLITARAVAPLPRLLALIEPIIEAQTECLFLKGASVDQEIAHAAADFRFTLTRHASINEDGVILQLHGIMRRGRRETS